MSDEGSFKGKGAGGYLPTKSGAPRRRGGGSADPTRLPGQTEKPRAERHAAARALFEGVPGSTCESIARDVGVPFGTVKRWKAAEHWIPAVRALPAMSARAGALADRFKTRMSELGKPLDDETAAAEVAKEVATAVAIDIRASVIDRHRKEWAAPRKIAYEAIQQAQKGDVAGGFERAKLAKITSETLTLIQMGECRAFGITAEGRGADDRTVVVVERGLVGREPNPDPAPLDPEDQPPAPKSGETSTTPDEEGDF